MCFDVRPLVLHHLLLFLHIHPLLLHLHPLFFYLYLFFFYCFIFYSLIFILYYLISLIVLSSSAFPSFLCSCFDVPCCSCPHCFACTSLFTFSSGIGVIAVQFWRRRHRASRARGFLQKRADRGTLFGRRAWAARGVGRGENFPSTG